MFVPMLVVMLPLMIMGMVLAVVLAPVILMFGLITGVVGYGSTVKAALVAPFTGVLHALRNSKPEPIAVPRIA